MGWTSYHATYYDKRGNIDRKKECDAYFEEGLNRGHYHVRKSAMQGSVYYAAVETLKRFVKEESDGTRIYEDIPENERRTWGVVFLTSTDKKDYYNFSYKDMDESMGPYAYDCPESILDLLSETDNEYASEWRKRCREEAKRKKKKAKLSRLNEGSIIRITYPYENGKYFKKGDVISLEKECVRQRIYKNKKRVYRWCSGRIYIPQSKIPDDYIIIKEA